MSYFKAKMHQIRFQLGLRPRPAGGVYTLPRIPLLDLRGVLLRGRRGDEWKREREKNERA